MRVISLRPMRFICNTQSVSEINVWIKKKKKKATENAIVSVETIL